MAGHSYPEMGDGGGGGSLKKIFFRPFKPPFGLKVRGSAPGPSPGSAPGNAFFGALKRPLNMVVQRNIRKRLRLRNKCKSHKNYSFYPIFIFVVPRRLSSFMFHNKPNRNMRKCLWKTGVRVKHVVRTCHVH